MTNADHRDPHNGVIRLPGKPRQQSLDEIYAALDAAGAADLKLERDLSPPIDCELN